MSVKLDLVGLNELRAALQALPEEMTAKADFIVTKYASIAANEIRAEYPIRQTGLHPGPNRKSPWFAPGILKGRVTVTHNAGRRISAVSAVKSSSPIAWLYEHGTEGRKRSNRKGANRGAMPAADRAHAMIPKVIPLRAAMVRELIELVESQGFEVTT